MYCPSYQCWHSAIEHLQNTTRSNYDSIQPAQTPNQNKIKMIPQSQGVDLLLFRPFKIRIFAWFRVKKSGWKSPYVSLTLPTMAIRARKLCTDGLYRFSGGWAEMLRRHLNFRQISHWFTLNFTNPSFQDLNGSHIMYWNMIILNPSRFKVEPSPSRCTLAKATDQHHERVSKLRGSLLAASAARFGPSALKVRSFWMD